MPASKSNSAVEAPLDDGDIVEIKTGREAGKMATLLSWDSRDNAWFVMVEGRTEKSKYSDYEFTRVFRPRKFIGPPEKPLRGPRKKSMLEGIESGEFRIFRANQITMRGVLTRWIRKHPEQEWSWAIEGNQAIAKRDK